jgi:hypothetical protein
MNHDIDAAPAMRDLRTKHGDALPSETTGQGSCRQKLVLYVDRALGAVDRVEEQRLDFADLFAVCRGGECARNADIDIGEIGLYIVRPGAGPIFVQGCGA